jgi:hypothetical protein
LIIQTFEFSVAAAAAASNLMPSSFNPIPSDGFISVYGILDSDISSITKPPTVSVVLGGSMNSTPVNTSSITGTPYSSVSAAAATSFQDPSVCPIVRNLPVRQGTNIQLLVAGGTGATATGRFRVVYQTTAEAAAGQGA